MNRCSRIRRSADTASPMDDENLLPEVLLRLPARPSSLPRASLVCKRWRNLVADPEFRRRFYAHHREAPIIGVFLDFCPGNLSFWSVMDPPDQTPSERFSPRLGGVEGDAATWFFHGCRHGHVVFTRGGYHGKGCCQVLVWDPVTGDRRFISGPPPQPLPDHEIHDWSESIVQADVLCVAGDDEGHVHGACHSSPFKVVLVCAAEDDVVGSCVYSSETCSWGDTISTEVQYRTMACIGSQSILVGNSLHWFILGTPIGILKLDLDTEISNVIELPEDTVASHHGLFLSRLGGGLGFLAVSEDYVAQLWLKAKDFDGAAGSGWMPGKAIELGKLLPLRPGSLEMVMVLAGEHNVMVVSTNTGVFMVRLESFEFKKISERISFAQCTTFTIHPFASFFDAAHI